MEWPLKIQGRFLEEADVRLIRGLQLKNPDWYRTRLSVELCHQWSWHRPDGQYKYMACREMLRKLEARGLIKLPPRKHSGPKRMPEIKPVEIDQSPVHCRFADLKPIRLTDARASKHDEATFNYLVKTYHYLSFARPVGQNMKYLIKDRNNRILGCLLFGAAAWKAEDRDRMIGWPAPIREQNLNLICNNTRFLILPWVKVPHLASYALAASMRRLSGDWIRRYGTPIVLVETFVDTTRFKGTCYRAANWLFTGKTKGRSRQDRYSRMEVPIKDIWLYPLRHDFRKILLAPLPYSSCEAATERNPENVQKAEERHSKTSSIPILPSRQKTANSGNDPRFSCITPELRKSDSKAFRETNI